MDVSGDLFCDPVDLPARQGFTLRAHLEEDPVTGIVPEDGFDAEQIAAFDRGEWRFAQLVVSARRGGTVLGRASVAGVVTGDFPQIGGVSYVRVRVDPLRGIHSALSQSERDLCELAINAAVLAAKRFEG